MAETKKVENRKKPEFRRTDAHKRIKLGKGVKKNQRWRAAKGRQNKIRLGIRNHTRRPKIGWGAKLETKDFVAGVETIRIENLKDLENVKAGQGILIANVGKKKRLEIIEQANKKKMKIVNRYLEKKK